MKDIQMVDLKSQYDKIKSEIDAGIQEVIDSTHFVKGPQVAEFEEQLARFTGSKHVITCGNGTDALQISLMALDLHPGDEVITVPFTFIATAEVIALLGLTPVFVDVRPDTYNMDVSKLEAAITSHTKAIVPVHLFGQCADMEIIMKIADAHHLAVIEDACQAIGAEVTYSDGSIHQAGTMGTMGCTSFFPSKNLGCYGDGGAIFTQDDELSRKLHGIVNHGMFVRYHHELIGVNSRLDTIQAAILKVKLAHLHEYMHSRQTAAAYYADKLKSCGSVRLPVTASFSSHVFHQYTLQLRNVNRALLIEKMKAAGIPVMIYYPIPIHLQQAYVHFGFHQGDFPVSEKLAETVISLPMHTELDDEQLSYICDQLLSVSCKLSATN